MHCMIDLETLATSTNACILTIGAVRFDVLGDELNDQQMDSLYIKVDFDSCDRLGLDVDDNTISWWASQSEEAKADAFSTDNRVDIADAFSRLYNFCWGAETIWSHGASFDIVICENVYQKLKKPCPWKYYQVRCSRTLFNLGIDPNLPTNKLKHNALQDAWVQAVGVQNIFRKLRGM